MINAEPSTETAGISTPTPDELLARDRWSRERLLVFQRARLRELLRHATRSSPYYRELLGRDAEDAELAELPTLPKATLMEHFDRVVTDPRLRLAAAEAHAAGPDPAALLVGQYHLFSTREPAAGAASSNRTRALSGSVRRRRCTSRRSSSEHSTALAGAVPSWP